ncbi:caspase-6-like isoform X1, partial [Clarias magur]
MFFPRPGHNPSSNGCGTPLFGFHFDIGIPAITRCCNQHDHCYDTCGRKKLACDEQFQVCLKNICGNLLKALGLDQKEACDSLVSQAFDGVMHLGCKVYQDSQKAAFMLVFVPAGQIKTDHDSTQRVAVTGQEGGMTETDSGRALRLDPNEEYNMKHKRRGLALIFNQENFFWQLRLNPRIGTRADKENLTTRFKQLGFEVRAYDDLKREEVLNKITEAAKDNHADADCFVCMFLSHGEIGHVYANDGQIDILEMTSLFRGDKCRSLVGKPKIFILQACRGDKHDDPVTPMDVMDSGGIRIENEVVVDAGVLQTLPAGADFIMCYSVAQGFYSHRDTVNGSWFIQDLCDLLQEYGSSLEFTELLTLVNRKVSQRSVGVSRDLSSIGKKQVPCFASMLTKKLYF